MPNLSDSIDALFAGYVQDGGPGYALAVVQDGKVIHQAMRGLANLEHSIPISADTVFEMASVSKQVTGFAIHLLVEDGVLSLDDDVRRHVPELPDFGTPITVRHCLHHTCGYREWGDAMGFGGRYSEDVWEPDLVMRWLRKQRALNHQPGEEFLYSNTGYFVLAAVVTAASGIGFAEFCRERIFQPLGMSDTHFRASREAVIKNRAESYFRKEDGTFLASLNNEAVPGATSMQTTIGDAVLWLRNLDTGAVGGRRVLDAMHQSGQLNNGQVTQYGSGIEFDSHRGEDVVFHTGGWACFCTLLIRMPSKGLALAVMSNGGEMRMDDVWRPVFDLFMGDAPPQETPEPVATPISAAHSELVGLYSGPGGPVIRVSETEGVLGIGAIHGDAAALIPLGGLRLQPTRAPDTKIEFFRDAAGRVSHYIAQVDGLDQPARFRVEPQEGAVDLAGFEGQFYSDELEIGYTLKKLDGVLTVRSIVHGDEPLKQIGRDFFVGADQEPVPEVFRFERDANGGVCAVLMGTSDARDQRFVLLPAL